MSGPRVLYHMVRADFLERVRRYSFLLTLGFSVYLGYAVYAGHIGVQIGEYRGVKNSAWLGSVMGLVASVILSLTGFYIVKNAIQRDRETGVGQILATTPMSKVFYTLSKTISNFAVLVSMVLILLLSAMMIQIPRWEEAHTHLFALVAPILIFGFCAAAVTAALSVFFETIPGLRGGFGNVIYFILWFGLLILGATTSTTTRGVADVTGIGLVLTQMQAQVHQIDPHSAGRIFFGGVSSISNTKTFVWKGVRWDSLLILGRALWLGIAAGLALLAALFFDRFDSAREGAASLKLRKYDDHLESVPPADASQPEAWMSTASLTPLRESVLAGTKRNRFAALVTAELRLLLLGRVWWWYAGAAILFTACLVSPLASARSVVIALAWLWPILLWSEMGVREVRFSTQSLIFSAPRAYPRQLLATWIAGILLAVFTGGGLALHQLLLRHYAQLEVWIAAALFIPSLALALGVCTESSKPFEAIYVVWWYIGPFQHTLPFDFMGTTPESSNPVLYLTVSILLVLIASGWRRLRLAQM